MKRVKIVFIVLMVATDAWYRSWCMESSFLFVFSSVSSDVRVMIGHRFITSLIVVVLRSLSMQYDLPASRLLVVFSSALHL